MWTPNGAEQKYGKVFSFQRLKCMQQWHFEWEEVSCLEKCPHFSGVVLKSWMRTNVLEVSYNSFRDVI